MKLPETQTENIPDKVIKMLHIRFVHAGKNLIDLEVLGRELHQNVFGGRAPPGTAGGAIMLPRLSSCYYGRRGRGRKGLGIAREGKGIWGRE